MKSAVRFFCVAFLVAFLAQWGLWRSVNFVDQSFWLEKVEFLKEDIFKAPLVFDAKRHAAHPGTLVLLPAAVLVKTGLAAADAALRLSLTLINTVVITATVTMARQLYPKSPWWLGVAGVVLFNPIYQNINPLDAVAASLTVLIFLTLWWCLERHRAAFLLAILLGLAAATRLHIALLLSAPVLGVLAYKDSLRRSALVGLGALITASALIPFWWLSPAAFVQGAVMNQLAYFTDQTIYLAETYQLSLWELAAPSPLAVFSLLLAVVGLRWKNSSPLPRFFAITLLAGTILILSIFGLSNMQSYRYVFPVIMVWEVLLPLFLLHAMQKIRWPERLPVRAGVMLLLSGTYMTLLIYSLLLPVPVYI